MDLFNRFVHDPSRWPVLWSVSARLPMSLDPPEAARARIKEVFASLSVEDGKALYRQFRAAMTLLATPAFAEHIQPWPWGGFGGPFSPERHRYAVERVMTGGPELFDRVRHDPSAVAIISTGPDRLSVGTPRDDEPGAGHDAVHVRRRPRTQSEAANGSQRGLSRQFHDPRETEIPATASPQPSALGRQCGGWLVRGLGRSQHLVAGALIDGAAVCWAALGCPAQLRGDQVDEYVEPIFVLSNTWAGDEGGYGEWNGTLDVTELVTLPTDQLRAAASSLAAYGIAREMPDDQSERAAMIALA
ncbi:MAG: hypothetical protein ACR2KJ_03180 [Jatrophihabitans sp.]